MSVGIQDATDRENRKFWNELCGSSLGKALGITDNSPASLKRFDDGYFDFYPYLQEQIGVTALEGKRVLEVGPGYGSVAQRLAEIGAHYHGLDIAPAPVAMARERIERLGRECDIRVGSILDCPFPDNHFDCVVAIGSLHHTGNLARAIDEVHRVLRPGGAARLMVYNAASYRQWLTSPMTTLKRLSGGGAAKRSNAEERMRGAYDRNAQNEAAPHTEFVTRRELRQMCNGFRSCRVTLRNIGADAPFGRVPRAVALRLFGHYLGLDLYCCAEK